MSNQSIQLLDSSVIHQLRSSLIISTLPECLKELIYNAIDANATNIEISIDIEKFSLQVNDNGNGIQNMDKIGQRHVTSKCHTLFDISQLKTFGFRGEALASITNEAVVQIISRHYLSQETLEGFWRDGTIIGDKISNSKHKRKAHPGTTVIVRDLFYKFPVRRKHLTSTPYQHVVIIESVKRLIINFALCFQNISFTLIDSARNTKILMVKKAVTCQDTFRQLFGLDMIKYTKYLDMHEDNVKVEGFYSTHGYPNKAHQYIFINNYFIPNNNELYKIVTGLFSSSNFKSLMEKDESLTVKTQSSIHRHPIFLIKFTCPDWSYYDIRTYLDALTEYSAYYLIKSYLIQFTNKFLRLAGLSTKRGEKRDISNKRSRLSVASESTSKNKENPYIQHSPSVTQMFQNGSSCSNISVLPPRSDLTAENSSEKSDFITWWDSSQKRIFYIDQKTGNSYLSPPTIEIQNSHTQNSIDRSHLKRTKPNYSKETKNTRIIRQYVLDSPSKLSKSDLQDSLILGQVDNKYIAIKSNQGFVMIDQHAADERIKLEEMTNNPSSFKPSTLETSICIELDSSYECQIVTSDRVLKFLSIWGIHIVTTNFNSSNTDPANTQYTSTETPFSQSRFFSTPEISPHFQEKKRNYRNRIYVTQLPQLILDRCVANHALLKNIIRDYAYWVKDQKEEVVSSKTCPKGIMEILKSKACRSAIMFNDILTKNQCKEIVERLARCDFPFQCAHGRPSAIPITLDLNSMRTPVRKLTWNNFIERNKLL